MDADLTPASMAAAKLTGASLLREFLENQLAPLRPYSLPMWRPHPSPAVLADEDLAVVLQSLVGGDVARLEGAPTPLFLRKDWEQVVGSMPVLNGDGPVPAEAPEDPVDVALIHDPTQPDGLLGRAPLVLSGHMHTSDVELDRDGSGTDWLTVGSTGGALASGGVAPVLQGEDPLDLTARMLYFDRESGRLVAYDDITMGGLGLVSVSIHRSQMPVEQPELEVPEGAETPEGTVPPEQEVTPGEGLPDEERVTPTDPVSPLPDPSDGGEG